MREQDEPQEVWRASRKRPRKYRRYVAQRHIPVHFCDERAQGPFATRDMHVCEEGRECERVA